MPALVRNQGGPWKCKSSGSTNSLGICRPDLQINRDTVFTMLMLIAVASPSSSAGLLNAPIYITVLPLVAIVCLSLIGMLMIVGLKK